MKTIVSILSFMVTAAVSATTVGRNIGGLRMELSLDSVSGVYSVELRNDSCLDVVFVDHFFGKCITKLVTPGVLVVARDAETKQSIPIPDPMGFGFGGGFSSALAVYQPEYISTDYAERIPPKALLRRTFDLENLLDEFVTYMQFPEGWQDNYEFRLIMVCHVLGGDIRIYEHYDPDRKKESSPVRSGRQCDASDEEDDLPVTLSMFAGESMKTYRVASDWFSLTDR